eukprot:8296480-Alexandrium_andersonii.AAC.1
MLAASSSAGTLHLVCRSRQRGGSSTTTPATTATSRAWSARAAPPPSLSTQSLDTHCRGAAGGRRQRRRLVGCRP